MIATSNRFLDSLYSLVYAYNFIVYIITGRLFRAELRCLVCFCLSSTGP